MMMYNTYSYPCLLSILLVISRLLIKLNPSRSILLAFCLVCRWGEVGLGWGVGVGVGRGRVGLAASMVGAVVDMAVGEYTGVRVYWPMLS